MQYFSWSFKNFHGFSSTLWRIPLNMESKVKKIMKWKLKRWFPCILFDMIFFCFFRNGHFHSIVSTFISVVKLDVENNNFVSTLCNVVHFNVVIHYDDLKLFDVANSKVELRNVVSTVIRLCPTSRRRINQKTTLKQHWNDCWVITNIGWNIF